MIKEFQTVVSYSCFKNTEILNKTICKKLNIKPSELSHYTIIKQSIDARQQIIKINLKLKVYINEDKDAILENEKQPEIFYPDVRKKPEIHIIGAGPAGLFAALELIEKNYKPIIIEQGKAIEERKKDIAQLNLMQKINPKSNWCFGEGGAGTFTDGKLYTRSSKRGDVQKVLQILIQHGANNHIKINNHPHIGTDKLPSIIKNIRKTIINSGGEIYFNTQLTGFSLNNLFINEIELNHSQKIKINKLILATGHSSADIYKMLYSAGIKIEAKPFAIGVRTEHLQNDINQIMYHHSPIINELPTAEYNFAFQIEKRGVYSFCMCPGGTIVPSSTSAGELVLNGMSNSKRNSPFANAGIVVETYPTDWTKYSKIPELSGLEFRTELEAICYKYSNSLKAPAQILTDFIEKKPSKKTNPTSYYPGLIGCSIDNIIPDFISMRLRKGFIEANKRFKGYINQNAQIMAIETRTSSPIRIPRNINTRHHTTIKNLYPTGEGAGYAGGITSSAVDGINTALAIINLKN